MKGGKRRRNEENIPDVGTDGSKSRKKKKKKGGEGAQHQKKTKKSAKVRELWAGLGCGITSLLDLGPVSKMEANKANGLRIG